MVSVNVELRSLSARELISYYGVHLVLIVFLVVLTIFIMTANPKDARAFLVAINFLAMALWVASDIPGWPGFMAPLVPTYTFLEFQIREMIFAFALQMVISVFIHIVLVFPVRWLSRENLRRVLPLVYGLPSGAILLFMFFYTDKPVFDHVTAVQKFRLSVDTGLLLIIPLLIFVSYRLQKSRIQRANAMDNKGVNGGNPFTPRAVEPADTYVWGAIYFKLHMTLVITDPCSTGTNRRHCQSPYFRHTSVDSAPFGNADHLVRQRKVYGKAARRSDPQFRK